MSGGAEDLDGNFKFDDANDTDDSGSESEGEIVVLPSQNGDEDGEGEDESLESHLNVESLKRDREEPSAEDAAKANKKKRKLQELKDKKKEPHIWAANDKKGGSALVPTGAAAQCKWLFDSYVEAMTKAGSTLTEVEFEDRKQQLPESRLAALPGAKREMDKLPQHIKTLMPDWKTKLLKNKGSAGSPSIVLVTYSAMRAVDFVRALKKFGSNAPILKLFAKHMKVQEQVTALKEPCAIAVGTPGRLLKLVELGALSLSHTSLVILDAQQDQKGFSIFTVPDVKRDFFKLFNDVLIENLALKMCIY